MSSVFICDYMALGEGRSAVLKMIDKFKQCVCIKFCMKLCKVHEMLHWAFGEHCLGVMSLSGMQWDRLQSPRPKKSQVQRFFFFILKALFT